METLPTGRFRLRRPERRYRFEPDALTEHAPRKPGIYQLLSCGADAQAKVLYIGAADGRRFKTVYAALAAHLMGNARPNSQDLARVSAEVYFDFIETEPGSAEDILDAAGTLIARHRPRLNGGTPPSSGRYGAIVLEEA